jgi:hypothetical protein
MAHDAWIRVELDLPVAVAELLVAVGAAAAAALDPEPEPDERSEQVASLAAAAIVALVNGVRQSLPPAEAGGLTPQDAPPPATTKHDRIVADVRTVLAGAGEVRAKDISDRLEAVGADWFGDQPRPKRRSLLNNVLWLEARRPNGRLRRARRGYYRLTAKGC